MLWNALLKPILFRFDPETVHYFTMGSFSNLCKLPFVSNLSLGMLSVNSPKLCSNVMGLEFKNPVGLAAGFDKEARWHRQLQNLGFGFVEVGTITHLAQPGNPKPRLFRLPKDQALLNRLGFNNQGVATAVEHLQAVPPNGILGINIGKSKVTPNEKAVESYLDSFNKLYPFASYVTINVSSPNTPGLRELQDRGPLLEILSSLNEKKNSFVSSGMPSKPILLKIAPDLTNSQIDDVMEICTEAKISGIIATNTTIERSGLETAKDQVENFGAGGISGKPVTKRSLEVVRKLFKGVGDKLTIIGVGGIFDGQDAWNMIAAGASLVQVYTGFIYGGPQTVKRINQQLIKKMESEGIQNISQVVGIEN